MNMVGALRRFHDRLSGRDRVITTVGRAMYVADSLIRDLDAGRPTPDPRADIDAKILSFLCQIALDHGQAAGSKLWRDLVIPAGEHGLEWVGLATTASLIPPDTPVSRRVRDLAEGLDEIWCEMYQMRDDKDRSLRVLRIKLGIE